MCGYMFAFRILVTGCLRIQNGELESDEHVFAEFYCALLSAKTSGGKEGILFDISSSRCFMEVL